jgi:hypothetical protein
LGADTDIVDFVTALLRRVSFGLAIGGVNICSGSAI